MLGLNVSQCCGELNRSRSGYYKSLRSSKRKSTQTGLLLNKVREIRRELPRIGVRKIHYLLRQQLLKSGHLSLGRDRLFELLRQHNMLIKPKRKYTITTNSNHPYQRYNNLILGKPISRKNQVWVSDITYIRTRDGFCYLSLVTDLYTRKIMGYHTNETLELDGCMKALKMALKKAKPEIHHSDRGSQYCSKAYTSSIKKVGAKISMTEKGNCYENAVAERVNGILKNEFNLSETFKDLNQVKKVVKQTVNNYNQKRPSWAIGLKTPNQMYIAA